MISTIRLWAYPGMCVVVGLMLIVGPRFLLERGPNSKELHLAARPI